MEMSVFSREMATISNPSPIMTSRSVFSFRKNRRAKNRETMYPRAVPTKNGTGTVSYTHLDVYKRQAFTHIW